MFKLEEGRILAYNIIKLLNWTTCKGKFEKDMILLFDSNFESIKRTILDDRTYELSERKRLLSYLRSFSALKNNMKIESTQVVIEKHDSIGVKAEMAIKEIKGILVNGNNKSSKELLYICEANDVKIYNYN
ncbi:hypothetical protein [Lysinibacillus sp. LK3]|uniref:hypothetical protein n=1 Tax=Lysinibacillus sp. LK3 TaxID=1628207 RepID=UPI000654AB25|nr:hypothetical protein [Lysinibacillus sp. LK3]KMN38539.1 hypothetical protein VK91_17260 [Lysinibacillus sp. LK3]